MWIHIYIYIPPRHNQPLVVQGLPIIDASLSKSPLDEWSARCRNLYLITHNTHKIRTRNPSKRATARPLPRPRGHWDSLIYIRAKLGYTFFIFLVQNAYIAALLSLLWLFQPNICICVIIFTLEWISVRMLIRRCSLHDKLLWYTNIWLRFSAFICDIYLMKICVYISVLCDWILPEDGSIMTKRVTGWLNNAGICSRMAQ